MEISVQKQRVCRLFFPELGSNPHQKFTSFDPNLLKAAAEKGADYCVRVTSEAADGGKASTFTCVPACAMYQSGFADTLKLAVGLSGHVQAVEEYTNVRVCTNKAPKVSRREEADQTLCEPAAPAMTVDCSSPTRQAMTYKTTVVIRRPSKGPQ